MISCPATTLQRGRYVVYVTTGILLCGGAVALVLSVPNVVSSYISNGLLLPVFRYGLLFSLIACGIVLSSEHRPFALVANLALFALALWFGVQQAGALVLLYEPLTALIVTYPVLTPAMGLTAGAALLLPLNMRRWLAPIVCAICGASAGLFILLESPPVNTHFNGWFASAAGCGCMVVLVASLALSDGVRQFSSGSWSAISVRIFASWLIAASLMLAALAIIPKQPRILDATNLPPIQERRPGDIVKTPNGTSFYWTSRGWRLVD